MLNFQPIKNFQENRRASLLSTTKMPLGDPTYQFCSSYKTYFALFIFLAVAILLLPDSASAATLTRPPNNLGLVGYWPMNEGVGTIAGDSSGSGRDGTLVASPPWVNGKHNKALQFTTSDNKYVEVLDTDGGLDFNGSSQPFTVSAWAKHFDPTGDGYDTILSKDSSGNCVHNYAIHFSSSTGKMNFSTNTGGGCSGNSVTVGTTVWEANKWYHVIGVYDGTYIRIYVNGVQEDFDDITAKPPLANDGALRIGWGHSSQQWNGVIDDVRIYNRALSATEISKLYKSGQVTRKMVSRSGLVGHWKFDEGRGSQAGDSSGNGNTGTLNDNSWTDGEKGGALSFNGSSSYVGFEASDQFIEGDSSFTLSAWFKTTSTYSTGDANIGGRIVTLFRSDEGGAESSKIGLGFYGDNADTLMVFKNTTEGGGALTKTNTGFNDNQWHFISTTYDADSNTLIMYFDGNNVTSENAGTISSSGSEPMVFGRFRDSEGDYNGSIDDVRIYNRALSATEIASLYQETSATINSSQNDRITNGLVGLWSFNGPDIDSTTAYDRSGQGRNATLYNSPKPVIGKVGQALEFDGLSNYTSAAGFSELGTSNQPYTIAGWVWVADEETQGNVVHVSSGSDGTVWCLPPVRYLSSGVLSAYSWPTNSADGITILEKEVWYQFATTWDSANGLRIFINGELESSSSQSTYSASGASNYVWTAFSPEGCAGNAGDFKGRVDEVRIYNRALTADEVRQLYLMGK